MADRPRAARFVAQFHEDDAIYIVNGAFVTRDEWFQQVNEFATTGETTDA